jgi:hypothetical protein
VVRVGRLVSHPLSHLDTAGETELGQDVLDVSLRRTPRDDQPVDDLLVAESLPDQLRDLPLATGQDVTGRVPGEGGRPPCLQAERGRARVSSDLPRDQARSNASSPTEAPAAATHASWRTSSPGIVWTDDSILSHSLCAAPMSNAARSGAVAASI